MLAALLLLAACPGPQATNTQTSPSTMEPAPGGTPGTGTPGTGTPGTGTPGTGTTSGSTPPREGPKLGEPCAPGDVCGEGACVTYFGIAGARGGELKSCEIRCDPTRPCEGERKCITVTDGPGQVCR
jgi:hypothetical protein